MDRRCFLAQSLAATAAGALAAEPGTVVVKPAEYPRALRNPLMGFRPDSLDGRHEWATLARRYLKWNELEDRESDGVDRIREVCNTSWRGVEAVNVKVIPRVYLHWDGPDRKFWPSDLDRDDYSSPRFLDRLVRLVGRLGEVWDQDPRVAFVQMGLIGKWGEHHSPSITADLQRLLGDAFVAAFPHKLVTVRHPHDFTAFRFGIYWDSWGHSQQIGSHGAGIAKLGDRWQTAPIEGEVAYNWGQYRVQPGDSPNDTCLDPAHRRPMIDSIRALHCLGLGWIAGYDGNDPAVRAGAEEIQRAFGYRLVLDEVRYPASVTPGGLLDVAFTVRNLGSTPLYYPWPVAVALLDPTTRRPVWQETVPDLDVRRWLPGDGWDPAEQAYAQAPVPYSVAARWVLPPDLPRGEYALALAILDPAANRPAVRLAVSSYWRGGWHPLGRLGVGTTPADPRLTGADDPYDDRTLGYQA